MTCWKQRAVMLVASACFAASRGSANGQDASQPPPITTIQAHARAVVLDIVVTDKDGHAVSGLGAKDFQVLEDGTTQRISSFEEIKPPTDQERGALANVKLPLNTFSNANKVMAGGANGTYTVILLDALNTRPEYQAFGYQQMKKWADSAVLTGPVAIFELDTSLHLVQGFTNDPAVLRTAVQNYKGVVLSNIPQGGGVDGPGTIAQRVRLETLNAAMRDISAYLSKFPGRKNLIWFTGTIPVNRREDGTVVSGPIYDPETFSYDFKSSTDLLTVGRVSLYPVDVEGLRTNPGFDAASGNAGPAFPGGGGGGAGGGVPRADRSAARKNDAITNSAAGFDLEQGTKHIDMQDVAFATGGKAYFNTNGISQVIASVVESGSHYYTLTYYPANKNWDGRYRKLKVNLENSSDTLEYRRGYYALAESNQIKPTANAAPRPRRQITQQSTDSFGKSMHLGALDPGTIVFDVHLRPDPAVKKLEKNAPLPPDNFMEPKYRDKPFHELEVDYKVPGKQFQITPTAAGLMSGQIEFAITVLDDQGLLVNSITSTVDMNLKPQTYAYMLQNGIQFPAKIAIPEKGNFFIRIGVHDTVSNKAGAIEVPFKELKPEAATP